MPEFEKRYPVKPALLAIACMVLTCTLNSVAADRKTFADLPPEAQASIRAALPKEASVEDFTLDSSGGLPGDGFGISVAIDGNTVVVGAFAAPNTPWGDRGRHMFLSSLRMDWRI